jgi:hypothetical protein
MLEIFTPIRVDSASALPIWQKPSTTFDERLATIQSWTQSCQSLDGHESCRPVPYAPLRLVSIGPEGSPLKLVHRDSATDPTNYATISYCWGKYLPLQTTKATLSQFTDEIPSELVPKTWADAIRIARALSIPHIWIDALCIVQDDVEEWQREVEHMCEIYQGSMLTIAAAQSTDSSQGCFPSDVHGLGNGDLFFRARPDSFNGRGNLIRVYRKDIRNCDRENAAINCRGWTLQELLLAPRLLLCMQPELYWQCRANYQSQTGISFELDGVLKANNMMIPSRGLQTDGEKHRNSWRRIIEGYSMREFTYPRDRIPAITGITRYFSLALDDVSILGLWRKSFAKDLAWLRGHGSPLMADTTGLPSWTWLAAQGNVLYSIGDKYDDMELVESLELLDWEVQWQGVPFASPVTSAQATVKGPVREIPIAPFAQGSLHMPPYFQVFGENLQMPPEKQIPWRCAGQFDASGEGVAGTYLCLQLLSESIKHEINDVNEVFLILEPVEMDGGVYKKYKRMGLGRIWGKSPIFDSTNTMSMILV